MILRFRIVYLITIVLLIVSACNNTTSSISSTTDKNDSENDPELFTNNFLSRSKTMSNQSSNNELHTVTVNKILKTSKYLYLNVNENDEQFWIAIGKKEITIGETYFYKGGLLKTSFESKELKKKFELIYLVSNLVLVNHGNNSDILMNSNSKKELNKENLEPNIKRKIEKKGSITIAELVKNHKQYEGKTIQISGECVKINPNIMGINWIHIKDGSKDDFDLVITSHTFVKEGSVITMRAIVTLNKDFGAGYKYDLILEDGIIVR